MLLEAVDAKEDERCFRAKASRFLGFLCERCAATHPILTQYCIAWAAVVLRRPGGGGAQAASACRAAGWPSAACPESPHRSTHPSPAYQQVGDFGLARAAKGAVSVDTFGTVSHMSPGE